jgi:hypothetical protein
MAGGLQNHFSISQISQAETKTTATAGTWGKGLTTACRAKME